ncbi:N-acetylgalactosamine-6-sulfatase [Saccharobesus litoralis]|uniref:N-acetylgalactosamine-6-sulfatase n=1 Tax=Saccharobesus litoralis TaxID=2172099 RepID=A0A2S0VQ34_9ALTE|nr:arylsulfatase [Saccharobesus litoralis]AWB66303.1 N-acetylgalactosamine-6-sulfatase [Saccharobesus litoralis]
MRKLNGYMTAALAALSIQLTGCGSESTSQPAAKAPAPVAKPTTLAQAEAKQPNIIFILADDIGYADLSTNGQKHFSTPKLDTMAEQGLKFTNFYAGSAVCAPSRSVLMTGMHNGRTPVRANYMTIPQEDGSNVYQGRSFKNDEVLVSEVLKDAGYTTGVVGKWGLGEAHDEGHPNKQGFDYFYGYLNHVHAHNHYTHFLWRNNQRIDLKNKTQKVECNYCSKFGFDGDVTPMEQRFEYVDSLLRDEAVDFIERSAKKDQPFFLYYSLISPHANNEAEQVDWAHGMEVPDYGEFDGKDWPETAKGYAAMMRHIDNSVGNIMDKLKALGIDDNTIVIFSGDNGPHAEGGNNPDFFDSNGELRGIKRDLYEGGIRMPTLAWGPGIVPAGKESDHIGYFGDVMATFAELAGTKAPDNLDSLSFAPELTGQFDKQAEHDYLYWEFHLHGSSQAVRQGNWKAIRLPLMTGPIELYDLSKDPSETTNVAAQNPELVAKFAKIMAENHEPHAYWPISKSDQSPDRQRNPIFKDIAKN